MRNVNMGGDSIDSLPIPGPRALPFLGKYSGPLAFMRDSVRQMRHLYQSYGPIVALPGGTTNYIFAFGPEYNQQILTNTDLFYNWDFVETSPIRLPKNSKLAAIVLSGLLQMNGMRHRQQRRLMLPAFHRKRVESYRDAMVALTEQKIAGWKPGQSYDLLEEMKELTISIAVKTLLGLDPKEEGRTLRNLLEPLIVLFSSPATILFPFNIPGLPYARFLSTSGKLEEELGALIRRKRASGIDEGDALSMLIAAHDEKDGSQLSNDELFGQTMTLFVASHVTTASALTWTLFLLTQHPRVLADLLDELHGSLHGESPTVEQLDALPLLEGVIKESMRLIPPFLWGAKVTTEPAQIGSYYVPKGANICYSPSTTHRIPELYPQPDKFLPERWQLIHPSPFEYLPFAAGPRMCIGSSFAMLELKLVIATLVQRLRPALPLGTTVNLTGVTFPIPRGGLPMMFYPQDRQFTKSTGHGSIGLLVDLD